MKLIAGLGNPGKKYVNTRHNIGYYIVEKLCRKYKAKLKNKIFSESKQAVLSLFGEKIIIAQPTTYMNLSGRSILYFFRKYNIEPHDILIVCDDVNLPIGKIRLRPSGSSGGHNGLSSIVDLLKTQDFARLRIGIQQETPHEDLSEFVLSRFNAQETQIIEEVSEKAIAACETWASDGHQAAMNKYN